MKTNTYHPEYLSLSIVKPKSKVNTLLTDGFYYAYQETDVVILFTKFICAN